MLVYKSVNCSACAVPILKIPFFGKDMLIFFLLTAPKAAFKPNLLLLLK